MTSIDDYNEAKAPPSISSSFNHKTRDELIGAFPTRILEELNVKKREWQVFAPHPGLVRKKINGLIFMQSPLEELCTEELQVRLRQNAAMIISLQAEISMLEANLTCHCSECLCPPPPLSTPLRGSVLSLDFGSIADLYGPFDVILMDPPWQLAGQQPTRGVALAYAQLSDKEIASLSLSTISPKNGLLFLWTINAKFATALRLIQEWGYRYIQDIVWVKRTVNRRLAKCHGFYLQHAKETCLVGIKGDFPPTNWNLGVASDVIYAERRGQSQKPLELYEMIERLIPNGRFLEIFGRRHNLRNNWVTIGNEL